VGHTLGLRHNFKASAWRNLDDILSTGGEPEALTGSVMDYNPAEFAAEKAKQGHYITRKIGPYDMWAIEYGYRPFMSDGDFKTGSVGAIAVANTVLMSVFERTREFGVVRAVGARPRFLFGVVLTESVLLSVVGGAVGVVLGRLGSAGVNVVSNDFIGLGVAAVTPRLVVFALLVAIFMGVTSRRKRRRGPT